MRTSHSISTFDRLRVVGTNLLLFLLLLGVITLNKRILRPSVGASALAQAITGSLPNFAAALFVSLCAVTPVLVLRPRFGRVLVYLSASIVFSLLALEELFGLVGASTQLDAFDILASAFGAVFACVAFELLVRVTKPSPKTPQGETDAH